MTILSTPKKNVRLSKIFSHSTDDCISAWSCRRVCLTVLLLFCCMFNGYAVDVCYSPADSTSHNGTKIKEKIKHPCRPPSKQMGKHCSKILILSTPFPIHKIPIFIKPIVFVQPTRKIIHNPFILHLRLTSRSDHISDGDGFS